MNLHIFNFNNYFNRIVIKHDTLAEYGTPIYSASNVNFDYADGVTTSQIINFNQEAGDYLVVTDNNNNILHRWFITDHNKTRNGQHRITLKHDLLADNYNKTINAPMIVERAMINSVDNPLLYNSEGFSFNQIKKEEYLLKDKTNSAWYVLYFKESTQENDTFTIPTNYDVQISGSLASSIYASGTQKYCENVVINTKFVAINSGGYYGQGWKQVITNDDISYIGFETPNLFVPNIHNTTIQCKEQLTSVFTNKHSTLSSLLLADNNDTGTLTPEEFRTLMNIGLGGIRVYSVADNKIYNVSVTNAVTNKGDYKTSGTCFNEAKQLYLSTDLSISTDPDYWNQWKQNFLSYSYTVNNLTVTAIEDTTDTYSWTLYAPGKATTDDSDYNIVAIPYNDCLYRKYNPDHTYVNRQSSSSVSQILVKSIIDKYAEKLVDVQLLPYCPLQNKIIDRLSLSQTELYTEVTNGSQYTFILYVPKCNFTFNINKAYTTSLLPKERKIENETKVYKIVSPNYNGSFEFSVAKNDGVNYFNVDVTLIPYSPYIHINPNFKGLYGADWDDAKGLICGGDFSLPRRLDQWEQYKINNKNYQQIFDRQIRNLDFNQSQERTLAGWNIASGTLQATTTGLTAGYLMGGAIGGAVGASVGGSLSLGGGLIDYSMLKDRQAENRQFTIDNWRYQLGNIKALPDTVTKVTPLTYNNKIFPFIEVYDCTDEEKNLFRNFLTYQSMTIQAVGTVAQYQQAERTFIQGKVIRLEDLQLSAHEAYEIYNEFDKGVFI